jgi:NitT/TauT family transport system ATP-binding protein
MVFQSPVLLAWRERPGQRHAPDRDPWLEWGCSTATRLELLQSSAWPVRAEARLELSAACSAVAICRALVHDPSLLLMDEPFGALDAMTRETMNLELQRIWLATKKTVLFVTHSIPEAVFLSDRVLVMTERPGTVDKIYDIPLPRPRSLQNMGTPEFSTLAQAIRGHFFTQGTVDH